MRGRPSTSRPAHSGVLPQERAAAGLEGPDGLLERGLEASVDGHDLARRLHLRPDGAVAGAEFVEGPAGYLHDAVVEGGLERGLGLLSDLVWYLVEASANGDLGGDSRDGVAGRLGGEGGRTADARVDFNHDVLHRFGRAARQDVADDGVGGETELDIAAALDAERPDDPRTGGAEHLVFLVGQGLAGGHDDGVAGVDAHRVEVFHVAYGDARVG